MELKLDINMDTAAFDIMPERELTAILMKVSTDITDGLVYGKCLDVNSNTVGKWEILD